MSEKVNRGEHTSDSSRTDEKVEYYRVRKSWADKASQIGAFCLLQNAVNLAQMNEGYSVFLDGVQVWPEEKDSPSKK